MKKFVTILLAATVLAAPMAQAQSRHDDGALWSFLH